jgi:hypothetical protein
LLISTPVLVLIIGFFPLDLDLLSSSEPVSDADPLSLIFGGRARIDTAPKGRLDSGFKTGTVPFSAMLSGVLLSLSSAEVVDALVDNGSTAESSTADGVVLVGSAVAATGLASDAGCVVGLLKRSRSVDL